MATTLSFKDIIDIPEYRPLGVAPNASIAGMSLAWDERPSELRHPEIFQLVSATVLNKYNVKNDAWYPLASPALTGTFGVGAAAIFAASAGPAGSLTTGSTTSNVVVSTALPAAVGANQLANRGDGVGFTIRIIGLSGGGSGKTEERTIVANTAGTTPTISVNSPFSFTPASGDRYEILSARVFLLSAGALAAGMWKYYDIATNSYSGNLATTNLPATVNTGSNLTALDEAHVPIARAPGEGYLVGASTYNGGVFGCLLSTGSAATTLTGQASAGDAAVAANEYRNFQIRIVEDTVTPTSVGQRRNITSHTAGASPVYTVPTWTVNPSAVCKYVIEQNTDRILLWSSASANTHTYSISGNTWDTTTFGVRGGVVGAGVAAWQAFAALKDAQSLSNPGMIYSLRGGAVSTIDVLDITAATAGSWSNAIAYGNANQTFTTGSSAAYLGTVNSGRYAYIQPNALQNFLRFDCQSRVMEPFSQLRYAEGAAVEGQKLATTSFFDGATKVGFLFKLRNTGTEWFETLISR